MFSQQTEKAGTKCDAAFQWVAVIYLARQEGDAGLRVGIANVAPPWHPRGMKDNEAFLLVATPDAPAGVRESVLLVAVHGDGGSLGFVINRPLDMSMREAVLGLGIDPMDAKLDGEVCKGGETEVDSAWLLFEGESGVPSDSCHLTDDIHVTASPDAAAHLLLRRPAPRLMLCRGHTTWDPGELEAELAEGRWLRTEASLRLLFETPATRRWSDAICQCLGLTRRWLGDTRFLRA